MSTRADYILPFVQGPRVLDVGCAAHEPEPDSPHWLHGRLYKKFPGVVGIDLSQKNIENLKASGFPNLYVGNAENFDLGGEFDTVVAGELIEHLSNPGNFLECANKHLAPGGRLVLTTPYPFSLLAALYATLKFPKTCENLEHTCWFCPQTFKELSRRAGFKIVHFDLIGIYCMEAPSAVYRAFVQFINLFGWLLPKRLTCNSMLFVLEKAG